MLALTTRVFLPHCKQGRTESGVRRMWTGLERVTKLESKPSEQQATCRRRRAGSTPLGVVIWLYR